MSEEFGSISKFVDLHFVHVIVGFIEELEELRGVHIWIDHAEPLRKEAVEPQVGPLLGAAFQDHIAKLHLLALPDVKFEKLVTALFEVN